MKQRTKDIFIVGFALFAIFFGAGNLIFPPYLGFQGGTDWVSGMVGFLATDPILPIIGVIVTIKLGGSADDIGTRVAPWFSKVLGITAVLCIATILAVPRTAATVHEIAIQPTWPGVSPWITSIIFFGLVILFVVKESKVVDIIGKYLTPLLIVVLFALIIVSIFSPAGEITGSSDGNIFSTGFTEGYQTMDALGAALMAGIVVNDFKLRGYWDPRDRYKASIGASIVALLLLGFIYGGLTYVGATMTEVAPAGITRPELLISSFGEYFGSFGTISIGIAVALACLTTAVGLTATAGNFFSTITNEKLKYNYVVVTSAMTSLIISIFGVSQIVNIAGPILDIVYPVFIAVILFSIFDKQIKYDAIYIGAVLGAFLIALIETLYGTLGIFGGLAGMIQYIPLASYGFAWFVPTLVGAFIGWLLGKFGQLGKRRNDHDLSKVL